MVAIAWAYNKKKRPDKSFVWKKMYRGIGYIVKFFYRVYDTILT